VEKAILRDLQMLGNRAIIPVNRDGIEGSHGVATV
jgi:hypothetical protein